MAAGDVKLVYAASSNLDVTNLHGLASSQTWIAGWESALIDNTTLRYLDYLISGKFVVEGASNQAGEIRVYAVAMLDDSTWPDVFDGTESVETITSTGIRDGICKLIIPVLVTNAAGATYYFGPESVASCFGGRCPAKFVLFVTGNPTTTTTAGLESTGTPNQITIKGVYENVAAA